MSAISHGYTTPRIYRQPSLNIYDDISSGGKLLSNIGRKYVAPAAKYVGKEALKLTTKPLPTIGQGIGLAAGLGATFATGNPELAPYLGSAGAYAGDVAGKWAQKKINTAIDKL